MAKCVYIHIPFCEKKCHYCSFCSFQLLSSKEKYLNALIKEIKFYYGNESLKTLYIGGGTPSLLEINEIERIMECFNYDKNCEITIEANPNSLNLNKIKAYKKLKINRLSIGVQSFDDDILKTIGRLHTKKDIYNVAKWINQADFKNFNIDLMYGLPNQDMTIWQKTIEEALKINPTHISTYGLKIEKGTFFDKHKPKNLPDDTLQAEMYELLIDNLKNKYSHYEFSNFAKSKKYYSKHNLAYWTRKDYYGFGLNASGFIKNKRYTNTSNISNYLKNPTNKNYEILTVQNQIEEEIFLGLRLNKGINYNKINKKYNLDIYCKYQKLFENFINKGLMKKTKEGVKLTAKGILISNEILCEFIDI